MIQDLQPMMHLVACLGGKTLVSFQGDGDPPQKKKKKSYWNPISQRPGLVYYHEQRWPILLVATVSNKHSLILSQ